MHSASSASVSTISTSSRSPSPRPDRRPQPTRARYTTLSPSPPPRNSSPQNHRTSFLRSSSPRQRAAESERKRRRRRSSASSVDSYISNDGRNNLRDAREHGGSRSTRRRFNRVSPPARGRVPESRSPGRRRRQLSTDRHRVYSRDQGRSGLQNTSPPRIEPQEMKPPREERSLSPFSKRLALTQAIRR